MDHADIAGDTIEYCQADALRRQLGRGKVRDARYDGVHCVECDEEIPEARRKTEAVTCIDCQLIAEARQLVRSHNIRIDE